MSLLSVICHHHVSANFYLCECPLTSTFTYITFCSWKNSWSCRISLWFLVRVCWYCHMIAVCQAEIGPEYRTWRQNVNSKDSFNALSKNTKQWQTWIYKAKSYDFSRETEQEDTQPWGRTRDKGETQTINTHNMTTGDEISERTADIICKRRDKEAELKCKWWNKTGNN